MDNNKSVKSQSNGCDLDDKLDLEPIYVIYFYWFI